MSDAQIKRENSCPLSALFTLPMTHVPALTTLSLTEKPGSDDTVK